MGTAEGKPSIEVEKVPTQLWVMRHAPTAWNKEHKIQGNVQTDVIEEEIPQHLQKMGVGNVPKPDTIVVSGLKRTRQTAEAVIKLRGWESVPVVEDEGLNERKWGVFEGKTHEEARAILLQDEELLTKYPQLRDPENFPSIWSMPEFKVSGGESLNELAQRTRAALLSLHEKYPGKRLFHIGHSGFMVANNLDDKKISLLTVSKDEHGEPLIRKEEEKPPLDAILVFGQGPVIDMATRVKASQASALPGSEDINFWGHGLGLASAILYKSGEVKEVIVMGGKTGDDASKGLSYKAEAELIGEDLERYGVRSELETGSTNTLENLVNLLNQKPNLGKLRIGILGSDFHIGRLRVLMEMFQIPYEEVFSAEAVIKAATKAGAEHSGQWNHQMLNRIERMLDINEAQKEESPYAKGFYREQKGVERKDISEIMQGEDVWRRVLGEIPQYWIGYLGRLEDGAKIREILGAQIKIQGEKFATDLHKLGVDLSEPDETLKVKLRDVKRVTPSGSTDWGKYLHERIYGGPLVKIDS